MWFSSFCVKIDSSMIPFWRGCHRKFLCWLNLWVGFFFTGQDYVPNLEPSHFVEQGALMGFFLFFFFYVFGFCDSCAFVPFLWFWCSRVAQRTNDFQQGKPLRFFQNKDCVLAFLSRALVLFFHCSLLSFVFWCVFSEVIESDKSFC